MVRTSDLLIIPSSSGVRSPFLACATNLLIRLPVKLWFYPFLHLGFPPRPNLLLSPAWGLQMILKEELRNFLQQAASLPEPWRWEGAAQQLKDLLQEHRPVFFSLGLLWVWEETVWIKKSILSEQFASSSPAAQLLILAVPDLCLPCEFGMHSWIQPILACFLSTGFWSAFWDLNCQGVLWDPNFKTVFQNPGLE